MKQLTRPVIGPSVAACTVAPDVWASRSGVPTMATDVAEPAELTFLGVAWSRWWSWTARPR